MLSGISVSIIGAEYFLIDDPTYNWSQIFKQVKEHKKWVIALFMVVSGATSILSVPMFFHLRELTK